MTTFKTVGKLAKYLRNMVKNKKTIAYDMHRRTGRHFTGGGGKNLP